MLKTTALPTHFAIARSAPEALERSAPGAGAKPLWELCPAGQMLELSGRAPGKLSTAARLIARAQAEGEPVAWVGLREEAGFYPPDFARAGVELAALVVVRLAAAGSHDLVRAAEVLLRSGAFGLVVIDLTAGVPKGELSWQARLSGLARRHAARVVFLTSSSRDAPSLGPLIALRVEPSWCEQRGGRRALLTLRLVKSKLGAGVAVSPDVRGLPEGAVHA
jgi:recombination protein RecA